MQIETRNPGGRNGKQLAWQASKALSAALDRFGGRVRGVRMRFDQNSDHDATCRVRVWCGKGPTVVVEAHAATLDEAINAAAGTLNQSLRRRWSARRARQRRSAALTPISPRKDIS